MKRILLVITLLFLVSNFSACKNKLFNPRKIKTTEQEIDFKEKEKIPYEEMRTEAIPAGGDYEDSFKLELKNNKGFPVFYSTDMDNYNIDDFKKYELPILIDEDTSIRFYAKKGGSVGNVRTEKYKIKKLFKEKLLQGEGKEEEKNMKKFISNLEINLPE